MAPLYYIVRKNKVENFDFYLITGHDHLAVITEDKNFATVFNHADAMNQINIMRQPKKWVAIQTL